MTTLSTSASPLRLDERSLTIKLFALIAGVAVLTASSWIEVPMVPVPMTMQTYAVMMIGMLYGVRMGAATLGSWLLMSFLGAPLLAGGAGGFIKFFGPASFTAGYLYAFFIAGVLAAFLAERGWNGRKPALAFANALIGNAIILGLGWAWLATMIGSSEAFTAGVLPFIIGAVVKSGLAAVTLVAAKPLAGKI